MYVSVLAFVRCFPAQLTWPVSVSAQCYTSAGSSDDLQDKARRTLKSVLQMCVYMPALDPLLHEAPPNILKYVVGQYSKVGSTRMEAMGLDQRPVLIAALAIAFNMVSVAIRTGLRCKQLAYQCMLFLMIDSL